MDDVVKLYFDAYNGVWLVDTKFGDTRKATPEEIEDAYYMWDNYHKQAKRIR